MSTQLATSPAKEIRALVTSDAVQQQLAIALPRYYTADQFTLIVRTAINRNPKLAECDQASFLTSMLTAAQMGLLPNGRDGHLIPRWNGKQNRLECTFQPDYKGLVGLIRRNETVADVYAVCVHKNDLFKITQGLHRDIIHEPDYANPGEIIGVYAVILFKSGLSTWEFLPRPEVESIRERSDSWKAHKAKGYDTPWKTDEGEMFKKTALKRVSKLADLSPDTMDRLTSDPDIQFERPADVVEVKRAEIPGKAAAAPALPEAAAETPAEPAAASEPEPVQAEAPKPTPAAKTEKPAQATVVETEAAKPAAAKKTIRKQEAAAPAAADPTPNKTEVIRRLEAAGFTYEQMDTVLTKVFECPDRDEETFATILAEDANWNDLIAEIEKL